MHIFPNGAGFHPEGICGETPMQLWMAPHEGAGKVMIRWPPTIELLRAMCTSTTQTTSSTGPSFFVVLIPHRNQTDNRQTNQSTQLFPISPHCPLWVEWLILTHLPFSFLHCYHRSGSPDLAIICLESFPIFCPDIQSCFWLRHSASLLGHDLGFPLSHGSAIVLGKQLTSRSLTLRTLHL